MLTLLLDSGFEEFTYYKDDEPCTYYRRRYDEEQELAELQDYFGEAIDEDEFPLDSLYFLIEASEDFSTIQYLFIEKKSGGITVASETLTQRDLSEFLDTFFG